MLVVLFAEHVSHMRGPPRLLAGDIIFGRSILVVSHYRSGIYARVLLIIAVQNSRAIV